MKKSKIFLALTLLVGIPILTYSLSFTVEKRYTAQVRLQVNAKGQSNEYPNPWGPIDDKVSQAKPGSVASQVQIMTGTEVLTSALEKARTNLPNKLSSSESASDAYENLVRRIQAESEPMSDVVNLRVTQTDPELAAELANDIAEAYQDYVERKEKVSNQSILAGLNTTLATMKTKLVGIDSQIAGLKSRAKVADTNIAGSAYTSAAATNLQQLDTVRSQYKGAVAELAAARRLLNTLPETIVGSVSTQANPVQLGLETDLTRLRTQLADLQSQFTDGNPQVKGLKGQIAQAEASLLKLKKSIPSGTNVSTNPAYQTQLSNVLQLEGRVSNLQNSVSSLESSASFVQTKVEDLPNVQRQIDGLRREQIALESSYAQIQQRRDVTEAGGQSRQLSVQIVSPALTPSFPSFPDSRLFVLAGLAVGGFLAILILMPRQDLTTPEGYFPVAYPAPTAPPSESAAVREPAMAATAMSDSAGLEAGSRRDP